MAAPAGKPAAAKPAAAKPGAKPAQKVAVTVINRGLKAAIKTAATAPKTSAYFEPLRRLMVGNQAGIVKVLGPNRQGVLYVRGIDDRSIARLDAAALAAIFQALDLTPATLSTTVVGVLSDYNRLPKKEAIAFLAAAGNSPDLDPQTRNLLEPFLIRVMNSDKDVAARRQAILALAVLPNVSPQATESVLQTYEHSENLWETFPVQQYFEYHADLVRSLSNYAEVRQRLSSVNSLYTAAVLGYLDAPPAAPAP